MGRPGLGRHPKFLRLVMALGGDEPLARGCLELLWDVCYESGDDILGSERDVELAAKWMRRGRTPGRLFGALRDAGGPGRFGFIEPVEDADPALGQRWKVHDLLDHAPPYVRRRLQREEARRKEALDYRSKLASQRRESGLPDRATSALAPALALAHAQETLAGIAENASPPPPKPSRKSRTETAADPRHAPLVKTLVEIYQRARGSTYGFTGHDARCVSELLALAGPDDGAALDVANRWTKALKNVGFPTVSSLAELKQHWNHFGGTGAPARGSRLPTLSQQHRPDDPEYEKWLNRNGE